VTREFLLHVAREAFAEQGYAGASMGDIAGRAGIRKSSLFHHFATKDALYRDAMSTVVSQIGDDISAALSADGTFLQRLDEATRSVQRYFGRHPVAARLLMREFVDGGAALSAAGDVVDGVLRMTVELIERGRAQGVITAPDDARQLAMSICGIHLQFFATPEVSARLIGGDVFSAGEVERRADVVVAHLHRLLGVRG
jgi:TetR/AcrR family transcriptional regulator